MELRAWQRLYLDALVRARYEKAARYETVQHFASIVDEPEDAVQELLLHRTIANIESVSEALELLEILQTTQWQAYEPRVLARIANTEAVLQQSPELEKRLEQISKRAGYTTYSLKDWYLISNVAEVVDSATAPVWVKNSILVDNILPEVDRVKMGFAQFSTVLDYLHKSKIPMFQVGVLTLVEPKNSWALVLHRALMAPYIELDGNLSEVDQMVVTGPAAQWSPHWKVNPSKTESSTWEITEAHTGRSLQGSGATGFLAQLSAVLAVSGLLKEGIQLNPVGDEDLVMSVNSGHPIWSFRRREFSAGGTSYQVHDIRAIALGILETMPPVRRVSIFRSRLSFHLISRRWRQRSSASIVTEEDGYFSQVLQTAKLLGENRFTEVIEYVANVSFRHEPIFRFLHNEAATALALLRRVERLPKNLDDRPIRTDRILCVSHASVPEQSGGYAIRAHGVMKSLREHGIDISAVTRPGFPNGAVTEASTVVVDGVPYHRLPSTPVTRQHGEIQHLYSFIEPFKTFLQERGEKTVHVRSTFLIALPALIAARELGLKILYEVSGLWELVYYDREEATDLLKRSAFAELAETITMRNVDQLVVMNEAVRKIAQERGVECRRIHIAPNAVDVNKFRPYETPRDSEFTIGYLGSFQDYEGLDDILDVVKSLQKDGVSVRALMVGDGLQFKRIRRRIVSEGLMDQIILTGRVPHEQVLDYYAQMDVLVYPRRSTGATETITPLKPFEALSLAKPIIVSDVAPLKEIVGKDERGLVFENGDVEDFARRIRELITDPSRSLALGQAGRLWVEEHRSWANVVGAFVTAYEEMATLVRALPQVS